MKTFKMEALALVRNLQTTAEAASAAAKQEREKMEVAFEASFKTLRDNELDAPEAGKHVGEVLAVLKGLPVEASLLTSFPAGAAKAPSERGIFDNLVMEQLETHLEKHIAECAKRADEGARAVGEHATGVTVAEAAIEESDRVLRAAAEALAEVNSVGDEAAAAVITKQTAMAASMPEYSAATFNRDQAIAALRTFEETKVASFEKLKGKGKETVTSSASEAPSTKTPEVSEAPVVPAVGIAGA
jgi:hypothetical protein